MASTIQNSLCNVTCESRVPERDTTYSWHVLENAEVGKPSRGCFRCSKIFGVKFIQCVGCGKSDELAEGVEACVDGEYGVCLVLRVASVKRNVDVVAGKLEGYVKLEPSDATCVR